MTLRPGSDDRPVDGADSTTGDGGADAVPPNPLLRFVPSVTFGLRAAALAGMVVSVSGVAGLSDVFDTNLTLYTTCCVIEDSEFPD